MYLLIVLALASTVLANECKKPQPVENFSIEKFSGDWFIAAFDSYNLTEAAKYKYATCGVHHFSFDNGETKPNHWRADYVIAGGDPEKVKVYYNLKGSYFASNPKLGQFIYEFTARNLTFTFTVMGTDYTTWAATYCCAQLSPNQTSEYVFVLVRSLDKYERTVHDPDVIKSYKDVLTKPVEMIHKVPHIHCPEKEN